MRRILILRASESEKTYCLVIFTSASFASQSAWGIECFAGFFQRRVSAQGWPKGRRGVVPWKYAAWLGLRGGQSLVGHAGDGRWYRSD